MVSHQLYLHEDRTPHRGLRRSDDCLSFVSESSLSSTISIDHDHQLESKKQQDASVSESSLHGCHVRFAECEVTQVIPRNPLMEFVPNFVLYYQEDEYLRFKSFHLAQAKLMVRGAFHGSSVIIKIFKDCQQEGKGKTKTTDVAPASEKKQKQEQHKKEAEVTDDQDDEIEDLAVGLERMSAKQIARDKPLRRGRLVHAVLEIQEHQDDFDFIHEYGHTAVPKEQERQDLKREVIRLACESISLPSRLFAQRLAMAEAAADDNNNYNAQQHVALQAKAA